MNKDQVKGKAKEVAGKIQETFGDAINSPEQKLKGLVKQVKGKVQKGFGDTKQAVDEAAKYTTDKS